MPGASSNEPDSKLMGAKVWQVDDEKTRKVLIAIGKRLKKSYRDAVREQAMRSTTPPVEGKPVSSPSAAEMKSD